MQRPFSIRLIQRSMLVAVALTSAPALGQNLVLNGSFETANFQHWTVQNAPSGSFLLVTPDHSYKDSYSAMFAAYEGLEDRISQILPTIAGERYRLSLWVYNHGKGSDRLSAFWEGSYIVNQTPCAQPVDSWSNISVDLAATTSGSQLMLGLADTPEEIYLDAISVVQTNLLENGGFETGNFNGWTVQPAAGGSFMNVVANPVHSGTSSALFGATQFQDDRISQIPATQSGKLYKINFWVYNSGVGSDRLAVFWEGKYILNQTPCTQPSNQWSQVTLYATATTNGSQLIFGLHDQPSAIYLDEISVWPVHCPADVAPPGGNDVVNVNDLLAVINGWGACRPPCPPACAADANKDCLVNVNDLLMVINNWGACPAE